ncbi:sulfatase-like hydrolase/transferase [Mariniflexile gromovii]|uniref:Sulfatase-like hydrolase/transferase n=1 Tax=Mariniflexile gromovii TaxID=362523 RepID=A0ABS4BXX3_9FLAO|nr:sulfatase-like hydrolase/transferase [Mariniflexile gromovii]
MPLDRTTLAGLLKVQGYRTAAIGKWHYTNIKNQLIIK